MENTETEYQHDPAEALGATTPDTTSTIPNHQCPQCGRVFTSAPALRMHHVRKHTKGWETGANFKGKKGKRGRPWKPGQLAKFRATMKKRAESTNHHSPTWNAAVKPTPKVKPNPVTPVSTVTFCPRCGCNIKVVAAAIAFGDNQ